MILTPREPMGPQAYVRLTAAQHARLTAMAAEAGVTFSEAVRQVLARGLEAVPETKHSASTLTKRQF